MNIADSASTVWDHKYVYGWCAILFILAGYELYGVFSGNPYTPPLTRITVRWVPWFVTLPFLTWLLIHFVVRYASPAYVRSLK